MTASRALARRLGVVTALCATALTLGAVVHAAPASAYGNCLVFDDYLVTDTAGNTYMQSDCVIELGAMGVGSGTSGSGHTGGGGGGGGGGGTGTGDGSGDGSSAVTVDPPPTPNPDPRCDTSIPSLVDTELGLPPEQRNVGFPQSPDVANPIVVYVTIDPNLQDGVFASTPWLQIVGLALADWTNGLPGAGITFLVDPTPRTEDEALAAMNAAHAHSRAQYHWHVRAATADDGADVADAYAGTVDIRDDISGHAEFVQTRIAPDNWSEMTADKIQHVLAHEAGHALGLNHVGDTVATSVMNDGGIFIRPTCSDFKAARRAMRQDPVTGRLPDPPPPGGDRGGDGKGD